MQQVISLQNSVWQIYHEDPFLVNKLIQYLMQEPLVAESGQKQTSSLLGTQSRRYVDHQGVRKPELLYFTMNKVNYSPRKTNVEHLKLQKYFNFFSGNKIATCLLCSRGLKRFNPSSLYRHFQGFHCQQLQRQLAKPPDSQNYLFQLIESEITILLTSYERQMLSRVKARLGLAKLLQVSYRKASQISKLINSRNSQQRLFEQTKKQIQIHSTHFPQIKLSDSFHRNWTMHRNRKRYRLHGDSLIVAIRHLVPNTRYETVAVIYALSFNCDQVILALIFFESMTEQDLIQAVSSYLRVQDSMPECLTIRVRHSQLAHPYSVAVRISDELWGNTNKYAHKEVVESGEEVEMIIGKNKNCFRGLDRRHSFIADKVADKIKQNDQTLPKVLIAQILQQSGEGDVEFAFRGITPTEAAELVDQNRELSDISCLMHPAPFYALLVQYKQSRICQLSDRECPISFWIHAGLADCKSVRYQARAGHWECECNKIYKEGIPCSHLIKIINYFGGSLLYYINTRWIDPNITKYEAIRHSMQSTIGERCELKPQYLDQEKRATLKKIHDDKMATCSVFPHDFLQLSL